MVTVGQVLRNGPILYDDSAHLLQATRHRGLPARSNTRCLELSSGDSLSETFQALRTV